MALADNLQGWWCPSLDTSGNGTTTLTDLSGNGNNGTLTNMDAATDWVADTDNGGVRALSITKPSEHIVFPDGTFPVGSSVRSFAWWAKPGSPDVQSALSYGGGNDGTRFNVTCSVSQFAIAVGSHNYGANVSLDSNWHHFAITLPESAQSDEFALYVDGSLLTTTTLAGSARAINTTNASHYFGKSASQSWDGSLDALAAYSRILTDAEVTQLYNGGRSLNLLATGTTQSIVPQLLLRRRRLSGGLVI